MVDEENMPEEEEFEEEEEDEDYEDEDEELEEDFEDEDEEETEERKEDENIFGFDDVFLHRLTVDILRLAFEAHRHTLLEGTTNAVKPILAQLIPLLTAFKSICKAYGVKEEITLTMNADDKELEQFIDKVVSAVYKLKEYGA